MTSKLINTIISMVESADAKELGSLFDKINQVFYKDHGGNIISAKALYSPLVQTIEWNLQNAILARDCGTTEMTIIERETDGEIRIDIPINKMITNLTLAKEFFSNPYTLPEVDTRAKQSSKIDWTKPIFTADEVKILLNMSDSAFRRTLNQGWITYSSPEGSDKKYFRKEDIDEFYIKNLRPSSK